MCSTQMWFWPTCWRASAPSCDGVASGFSFEKFTGSRLHRGQPSWTDCWDSGLKFNVLRFLSRLTKSSVTVKRSKMNISDYGNRAGRSVRTSLGRSVSTGFKLWSKNKINPNQRTSAPLSANDPLTSTPLHQFLHHLLTYSNLTHAPTR